MNYTPDPYERALVATTALPDVTELRASEPDAWLSSNWEMQRQLGEYAFFDLSGGPLHEIGGTRQVRFQLNFTFGFGL